MATAINGLTLLQSLHYSKKAMTYLLIGLFIKLALQFPLVYIWQGTGAILATAAAFLVICFLAYHKLRTQFNIHFDELLPILLLNFIFFEVVMGLGILTPKIYVPQAKLTAFIYSCVCGAVLLSLYLACAQKFGLLKKIFKSQD